MMIKVGASDNHYHYYDDKGENSDHQHEFCHPEMMIKVGASDHHDYDYDDKGEDTDQ